MLISQQTGLAHLASGDLFREVRQQNTEIGRLVKSFYDRGELVPDEVTIRMILERLGQPDCQSGCLLDGFPRTLQQAEALDGAFQSQGKRIDKVVSIAVDRQELLRRLSGRWLCRQCGASYQTVSAPPMQVGKCDRCDGELYQRPDDTEATAKNRLDVYDRQTAPLADYYRRRDALAEVNGQGSVESVQAAILEALR